MSRPLIASLIAMPLLFAACDKTEEPRPAKSYRISWIAESGAAAAYQVYEYTADGRVSEWKYSDGDSRCMADYQYRSENEIDISAEENIGDERRLYSEKMQIADGLAHHAEGTFRMFSGDKLTIQKRYTADFSYTADRHLAGISIAEWVIDSEGNDLGKTPLCWTVTLNWDPDGNLQRYAEYTDPARPMLDVFYTYYGGETVAHLPILQSPILRRYYLPLQYYGYLGHQSKSLLQKASCTTPSGTIDYTYNSYDLSASSLSSWVESYTVATASSTRDFYIAWEDYIP